MKRLALFLIYDKQGIIDDYIAYLIDAMKVVCDDIVVISNSKLLPQYEKMLATKCSEIYFRENKGYDAGGFKDAICEHIGWNRLYKYDEVIFMNDSFFGPLFSLDEMFTKMEQKKELDFWSVTKSSGNTDVGEILQTYFFVVRSNMLRSKAFYDYWTKMPYYRTFKDAVTKYERKFALYFSNKGFKWDSYIDPLIYTNQLNNQYMSPYHCLPFEIIKNQRYPFIKKKLFSLDYRSNEYGLHKYSRNEFLSLLEYLNGTNYPEEYIWANIIRIYGLRDIQDNCCDYRIVPKDGGKFENETKLIVVYLTNEAFINDRLQSLLDRVKQKDLRVYCDSDRLKNIINSVNSSINIITKKTKRDFLKDAFEYIKLNKDKWEYVGFLTEPKIKVGEEKLYTSGVSTAWNTWENMFGEREYINNILSLFVKYNRYGVLVVPKSIHGEHVIDLCEKNGIQRKFANRLNVGEYIERDRYIADYSESFWIRSSVLDEEFLLGVLDYLNTNKKLVDIFKIIPYYAQKKGYYTAVVQSELHNRTVEKTMELYCRNLIKGLENLDIKLDYAIFAYFFKVLTLYTTNIHKLAMFLEKKKKVYIYGCGLIARLVSNFDIIENRCNGYVVSDNKKKQNTFCGKPVIYLSEVNLTDDEGILIALNHKHSNEVKDTLVARFDEKSIFWIDAGE